MRILHFSQWTPSSHCGVTRKIVEQCSAWLEAGAEVSAIMLSVSPVVNVELPNFIKVVSPENNLGGSLYSRYLSKAIAVGRVAAEVRAFRPDLTYARTFTWAPGYLSAIAPASLVMEVNTNDEVESRNYPFAKRVMYLNSLRRIFRRADGFVAVTQDLAEQVAGYGKPTVAIGNGISRSRYSPALAAIAKRAPAILFVGTPGQPWHGLDRVLMLAQAMPDVTFHIVGPTDQPTIPNVEYHGLLNASSLELLYASCSVGIGSLALERVNMRCSSSLKVREYLACGLPVLLESPDADLMGLDGVTVVPWGPHWVERASKELRRLMSASLDRAALRSAFFERSGSEEIERRRLAFFSAVMKSR